MNTQAFLAAYRESRNGANHFVRHPLVRSFIYSNGITKFLLRLAPFTGRYSPSTDWAQGGPIIDREGIALRPHEHEVQKWSAEQPLCSIPERQASFSTGPTPLIAAMHCFVVSKPGPTADIPDELA